MNSFEKPPQFRFENKSEQVIDKAINDDSNTATSINTKGEILNNAKEKLSTYLKHQSLKIKEYFRLLNQKDFDQLLELDFQQQLKDTPPIKGVFSPEKELAKIKKLPKEQKRESLRDFKKLLARQREALAACRIFIERSIEFNHDTPKEKLTEIIEKFAQHYGFDERQKKIANSLVDAYFKNRQKVLRIRQQIPDDYKLVSKLSGINLEKNAKIQVSVGPMTIDIDADAFTTGRLYEKSDKPKIGFIYGGFAAQSADKNPIYYIVINKNKWIRWAYSDLYSKGTRKHEYEHQKNKLFRAVFDYQRLPTKLVGYEDEQDMEIKKTILEDFFDKSRAFALERVKDEITACLLDRSLSRLQNTLEDLFFTSNETPYDYLAYLRNWKIFKNDPLYQETAQRMLVKEYKEIIKKAVASYAELVKRGKYTTQEAIALLTDAPLTKWPKTIKRLLEQRKQQIFTTPHNKLQ